MHCYYCILSAAQEPVLDLHVLDAASDETALVKARELVPQCRAVDRLAVYHGERLVASLQVGALELRTAA